MSSFPYNNHKYSPIDVDPVNGYPLNYKIARELAHTIRWWHSQVADTDDWTQSNDGAEADVTHIALGLMELLGDPGAVRRLAMAGEHVEVSVDNLMETGFYPDVKKVIEPLFKGRD